MFVSKESALEPWLPTSPLESFSQLGSLPAPNSSLVPCASIGASSLPIPCSALVPRSSLSPSSLPIPCSSLVPRSCPSASSLPIPCSALVPRSSPCSISPLRSAIVNLLTNYESLINAPQHSPDYVSSVFRTQQSFDRCVLSQ